MNNKIQRSYMLIDTEGFDEQKTLFFDVGKNFDYTSLKPGMFFMIEYAGTQKPFSFSHFDGNTLGITIQARGACTKNMLQGNIGDYYGITGPLGNGFDNKGQSFLLVAGGIGTAPIYYYAKTLINQNKKVDILFGARTSNLLEYTKPLSKYITYYTDDGSLGKKGFVTDDLSNIIKSNKYDLCCICGPEKMMSVSIERIKNSDVTLKTQVSMERYMKCGLGICGSCVIDDRGDRVCSEGPVFDMEYLLTSPEFGRYYRNSYGQKENL